MRYHTFMRDERGAALVEFTIGAVVFLTATFAVLEFGRLLWAHNALTDATRRGARYAVNQSGSTTPGTGVTGVNVGPQLAAIRNVTVYGNPAGGTKPLVDNLTTGNVEVAYSNFALGEGTVTVSVVNYDFKFVVPIIGRTIRMPAYRTPLTAENAGLVP